LKLNKLIKNAIEREKVKKNIANKIYFGSDGSLLEKLLWRLDL